MATNLFGPSPLELQQQQQAGLQARATQYAQLNPLERAAQGMYQAGSNLGGGIAGMMGIQDPAMARQSAVTAIASNYDRNDPAALIKLSQELANKGFMQESEMAAAKSQELAKAGAENQFKLSEAALKTKQAEEIPGQISLRAAQEAKSKFEQLTEEQSQKATQAYLEAQGMPAKQIDAIIKNPKARESFLTQTVENTQITEANGRVLLVNKQTGGVIKDLGAGKKVAQVGGAEKPAKPLSAGLQKDELTDLAAIDTYAAQQEALAPSIQALTPDIKGVRSLELGPLNNAKYATRNAAGRSTPESRAYEALQSAVKSAVNLQSEAAKGVQTDKDVLRYADALISSFGKNDTQATLDALTRYKGAIAKAAERTQVRVESRRKSQNVEPYGFSAKPSTTSFTSVAEAEAANLPKGTSITINGRKAVVE